MAGDWIKMRVSLATDPAVIGIAARLDCTEFEVVGMLHHVWSWADTQSRDGHAPGVTEKWVDRYVQCDGFAQAMQSVGWLVITEDGVEFPHFDRHNGKTAKTRALGSNRQKKHRANVTAEEGQMSRSERDKSVTREEIEKSNISPSLRSGDSADAPAPEPKPSKSRVSITAQQMVATLPGLTAEVAGEYLQYRSSKRAKLTPNAWAVIATEIVKSGMRPDAALAEAMAAGWQGLKASWLANRETGQQGAGFKTAQEKRAERNAQIFDYDLQMQSMEGMTR